MKVKLLFCWGANSHGQHGSGDCTDSLLPRRVDLPQDFDPSDIVGGGGHTLVVGTNSESKPVLLSCGSNSAGQLGHSPGEKSVPTWREVELPPNSTVMKAAAGWDFSAVILEDHTLLVWGSNRFGQLSQPLETTVCHQPKEIPGRYRDVACGMRHTVLCDVHGHVFTCGAGRAGQLGGEGAPAKSPKLTKVEFDQEIRPLQVVAGAYHSAIRTDNSVYVWGSNKYGQCQSSIVEGVQSAHRPTLRLAGQSPTLVSGWTHLAALTNEREVLTWGRSDFGQLGRAVTATNPSNALRLVEGLKAKELSCGSEHVVALSVDDQVYCWGWNEHGMCGTGDEVDVREPRALALPAGVRPLKVGCGAGHSFVICEECEKKREQSDDLCVVTSAKDAQNMRHKLEDAGLFDKRRRVERCDGGMAAIPVNDLPQPSTLDDLPNYRIMKRTVPKSKMASSRSWREKLLGELTEQTGGRKVPVESLPRHYECHGDMILLPAEAFTDKHWDETFPDKTDLWKLVTSSLGCVRLARKSTIKSDGFRSPQVEILIGNDGKVQHVDNGITYTWNVRHCMFSAGNVTEKLRISKLACQGEVIVDLYAGIGYFTLPYLVHAGAARVHACEWNPHAVAALKRNLVRNGVEDRCTVYEGDNRELAPRNVADRVNLGLISTSEQGWVPGCLALKRERGGVLHIHQNIVTSSLERAVAMETDRVAMDTNRVAMDTNLVAMETVVMRTRASQSSAVVKTDRYMKMNKSEFAEFIRRKLTTIFLDHYSELWDVRTLHVERVKSYAPRIDHCVFDIECRPLSSKLK